jgi:hypothetical protein
VETIAFYSYKGGVGRTLLLANTARFLASLGKRVVALDLDLEAPGLHYKLKGSLARKRRGTAGGAVSYLVATAEGAKTPPGLDKHLIEIAVPPGSRGRLRLMPAGPAPDRAYWTALKELQEVLRLDDPGGRALLAVLDLQARIEDELKPHYLLIDARTGVTELGGLATTVLADTVLCLFAGNQESIEGTLTVAEALREAPRLEGQGPIRIVPVLARASALPAGEALTSRIERLLVLGDCRPQNRRREKKRTEGQPPKLFTLPHDEAIARGERLIAGEQAASAFSPLYKAYHELFVHLFPELGESAQRALHRLEAVATIRDELTEGRSGGRYGFGPFLAPWDASAVEEAVVIEANRGSGKGADRRYADLVCREPSGRPAVVAEYLEDEASRAEAVEFWQGRTAIRCLVLVTRKKDGRRETEIWTRAGEYREFRHSDRWDVPLPKELEAFPDVGDRSVEALLDALRRGHQEAAGWLVEEWQMSLAALSELRAPPWRPARARRILDGLAATEDAATGESILRRAALADPHPRLRERKMFRGDLSAGDDFDRWMEKELFAPLFWRLPVEAVARYQQEREYPGQMASLAGYRLLAHDLMGLEYDPVRSALEEARGQGGGIGRRSDFEGDEEVWPLRSMRRGGWRLVDRDPQAPPPALARVARPGAGDSARERDGGFELEKLLRSSAELRRVLRAQTERGGLIVDGLLGHFGEDGRILLYPPVIVAVAEVVGATPRHFESVVFIHLATAMLAYRARDLDGEIGHGFAPPADGDPFRSPSPVHVGLIQAFSERLIRHLQDASLQAAFDKLSDHLTKPYRSWRALRSVPLEELRVLLLRARGSRSALGWPRSSSDND